MTTVDLSNQNVYDYVNMGEIPNNTNLRQHDFEDNILTEQMMYEEYHRQIKKLSESPSPTSMLMSLDSITTTPMFTPCQRCHGRTCNRSPRTRREMLSLVNGRTTSFRYSRTLLANSTPITPFVSTSIARTSC